MKENEFYQQALQSFSEKVESVMRGDLKLCKSMIISANDAYDVLEAHGLQRSREVDYNGWELDFWQQVVDEETGKEYMLSGSGWYGGVCFCPEE